MREVLFTLDATDVPPGGVCRFYLMKKATEVRRASEGCAM